MYNVATKAIFRGVKLVIVQGVIVLAACTRVRKKEILIIIDEFEVDKMVEGHEFRPGNWVSRIMERSKANAN